MPNTGEGGEGAGGGAGAAGAGAGAGAAGGAAGAGSGDQGGQQQQQQNQQSQVATRPDYIPETYWDAEKGAPKVDDISKIFQAHEARSKGVIADWSKHELKTSVKGLDDKDIEIDRDAPMVKALGEIAKERGWTGEDVQPLIDMVATMQRASAEAEINDFLKLGGGDKKKASDRTNAVITKAAGLLGYTGQAGGDGKVDETGRQAVVRLMADIHSSEAFEVLEKLINAAQAPGSVVSGGGGGETTDIASRWYGDGSLKKKAS